LAAVSARGALALEADASSPTELQRAMDEVRGQLGSLDVIVNAVTASRPPPGGPWGGGPVADVDLDAYRGWASAVGEQAAAFLSSGARALRQGDGGTLIQVTGGSSRRAMPGRGSWAAGAFSVRALTQAAAQELRLEGIHVALLIVDATIESNKTAGTGGSLDSMAEMGQLARAVQFLAEQQPRGYTHELQITPAAETWVP
jgi:NAD(P)-dependent dehydrogenase (short-subunit alcohol dehydrogenase family)